MFICQPEPSLAHAEEAGQHCVELKSSVWCSHGSPFINTVIVFARHQTPFRLGLPGGFARSASVSSVLSVSQLTPSANQFQLLGSYLCCIV